MSKFLTSALLATGFFTTVVILVVTGKQLYSAWDKLNQEVPFTYQMASPRPDLIAEASQDVLGTSTDSAQTDLQPEYSASESGQVSGASTKNPIPTATPTPSPVSTPSPTPTPQPINPTPIPEAGTVTRVDEAGEWRIYRLREAGTVVELPSSVVIHNQLRHRSWKLGNFNRHCWTVSLQASRWIPFRLVPLVQADGNTCETERVSFAVTTQEENVSRQLTIHDIVKFSAQNNHLEVALIDGKTEKVLAEKFGTGWKITQSNLLPANTVGFIAPTSKSPFQTVTVIFDKNRLTDTLINQILLTLVVQ